jgi:ATP-dependent RNA helicase RhlE
MPFTHLKLIEPLCRALAAEGYERPTPIQEKAIPEVLTGRDLLGCAQTGTGKTAAFSLPLLQLLARERVEGRVRALVLSPTRELAAQIGERIGAYGTHLGLRHAVIYGGVSQFHQVRSLKPVPAIVVATPGRLLDLCSQRLIDLSKIEILVLDEADRMLDMGFIHDVRKVVAMTPKSRQTLFFSATMPPDIVALAKSILKEPVRVDVAPTKKTADTVRHSVYFVAKSNKRALLEHLLQDPTIDRALVFTRTKHGASRIAKQLDRSSIRADAIHGDKTQGARERALAEFRSGTTRVLVATDIAARGIDVDGVSHVVNFDLPNVAESYVHRIGRTGRAGAEGLAFSFCDDEERPLLAGIERLIGQRIPVVTDHPLAGVAPSVAPAPADGDPRRQGHSRAPQGGQRPSRGGGGPRPDGRAPQHSGARPSQGGGRPQQGGGRPPQQGHARGHAQAGGGTHPASGGGQRRDRRRFAGPPGG